MNNPQERQKIKKNFRKKLLKHVELFNSAVTTDQSGWVMNDFISAYN
jgi:hypothetical protein